MTTRATPILPNGDKDRRANAGEHKLTALRDLLMSTGMSPNTVINAELPPSKYSNDFLTNVLNVIKVGSAVRKKQTALALSIEQTYGQDVLDQMLNNKWTIVS